MNPPLPPAAPAARPKKPNVLLELGCTILVPAIVLMQLSRDDRLGPLPALLLALAFPLGWGVWDGLRRRKVNPFAVIGLVSTLLTGGIGVLKLDAQVLAIKEAAVPGLIGLVVAVSAFTRWPLIRAIVFNDDLFEVERVRQALAARASAAAFEARLRTATLMLAATFAFSSVMNYLLATWVVTSPAGSTAFNEQLGRLTLLSYPVIALPSMAMMLGLMWWLANGAKALTGLSIAQMLVGAEPPPAPARR
jgi:intracellular septation protein A